MKYKHIIAGMFLIPSIGFAQQGPTNTNPFNEGSNNTNYWSSPCVWSF